MSDGDQPHPGDGPGLGGRIRWAGTRAFLVEQDSLADVLSLHAAVKAAAPGGMTESIPAAATLFLAFDSRAKALAAVGTLASLDVSAAEAAVGREHVIDVVYDGEDLADVADLLDMTVDEVIEAHTSQTWTAAFGGFAPGFAYLTGENDVLNVPRRTSPRTAVPSGAVAIAGEFSAVYPRQSPGGWQLLGRTDTRMWDLDREDPALVHPGDKVRFRAVAAEQSADAPDAADGRDAARRAPSAAPPHAGRALEIVDPGLQSLIEDAGRPGLGEIGVPAAGAVDPAAARQANRLVGNPPDAAVIENVLGNLVLRAHGPLVLALSGARAPARVIDPRGETARAVPHAAPFAMRDGEQLLVGDVSAGLRPYIGVRGGLDVPPVLGSRSTDSMSGVGPAPLSAGTVIGVGHPGQAAVGLNEPTTLREPVDGAYRVRVTLGPRDDWFDEAGIAALTGQDWLITPQSNRVGVRLDLDPRNPGARALSRAEEGELRSEGAPTGALQVPPSGLPVLFLNDHPVTGGYPIVACVVPEDLTVAAQLAPGALVRFALVDPASFNPRGTP